MKLRREFEETDNSTVYRRSRWRHLAETTGKNCPICAPNRGCNRCRDRDRRNWKRYRRTQYKAVDIEYGLYEPNEMAYLIEAGYSRNLIEMLEKCPPVEEVLKRLKESEQ